MFPQNAIEEAQSFDTLKSSLFEIDESMIDDMINYISKTPYVQSEKSIRQLIEAILITAEFQQSTIPYLAEMMFKLQNTYSFLKSEFNKYFIPEQVKYYYFTELLKALVTIGFYAKSEISALLSQFREHFPHDIVPAAYFFIGVAPFIESGNPALFKSMLSLSKMDFRSFYELTDFFKRLDLLKKNNWELYWKEAKVGYPTGSIASAIKQDNIDELKKFTSDPDFDINQEIKFHSFENSVFPEYYPSLIDFASFYGSIKCFKFILLNGGQITGSPKGFSVMQYAVAGGNIEILKILEQKKASFAQTLPIASLFHRASIFKYIFDSKERKLFTFSESSDSVLNSAAAGGNVGDILFCVSENQTKPNIINSLGKNETTPLVVAAKYGRTEIIRLLLSSPNIEVNACDLNEQSALSYAAAAGRTDIVEMLLKMPGIIVIGTTTLSPLQSAANNGHRDVIKLLLQVNGIDLVEGIEEGDSAFGKVLQGGYTELVPLFLAIPDFPLNGRDFDGNTFLHFAARKGDPQILKMLLDNPKVPKTSNSKGQTALHILAESSKSPEAFSILISSGLDPFAADEEGNTPLHIAAAMGSVILINHLLKLPKIDVNVKNNLGQSPLHLAAKRTIVEPLKALLSAPNLDINIHDNNGMTPLHLSVQGKSLNALQVLVAAPNIDLNSQNEEGETVLHLAARNINLEVLNFLIGVKGINPNAQDINGQTPLFRAARNTNAQALPLLLKAPGINVNIIDNHGQTALFAAAKAKESVGIKALLAVKGININLEDENGQTALHIASIAGTHNIIQALIENGIDKNHKDHKGKKAEEVLSNRALTRTKNLFSARPKKPI